MNRSASKVRPSSSVTDWMKPSSPRRATSATLPSIRVAPAPRRNRAGSGRRGRRRNGRRISGSTAPWPDQGSGMAKRFWRAATAARLKSSIGPTWSRTLRRDLVELDGLDIQAEGSERMQVAVAQAGPVDELDGQFEAGLGGTHELALVDAEHGVEGQDRRDRGLADPRPCRSARTRSAPPRSGRPAPWTAPPPSSSRPCRRPGPGPCG